MNLAIKEWREKRNIFFFGLGILLALFVVYLINPQHDVLLDGLTTGILFLVLPFVALLLGSAGFAAEYRNDAWAYLFSRPVKRFSIWTIKYIALFGYLVLLWLIFFVMIETFPTLRIEYTAILNFQADFGFLSLVVLVTWFCYSIAFSLSHFGENPLNIFFLSLFISVGLGFLVFGIFLSIAEFEIDLLNLNRAVPAFFWGIVLVTLALLAGSARTFQRGDFSERGKKIIAFLWTSSIYLVLAVVLAAAGMMFMYQLRDSSLWRLEVDGREALFFPKKGLFRYDPDTDKLHPLTRSGHPIFDYRKGKIAYVEANVNRKKDRLAAIRIMNSDGTDKRSLDVDNSNRTLQSIPLSVEELLLSPDGEKVLFLSRLGEGLNITPDLSPLWCISGAGKVLKNLPLDPAMGRIYGVDPAIARAFGNDIWLYLVAWPEESEKILIAQKYLTPLGRSYYPSIRFWIYDLKTETSRVIFDNQDSAIRPSSSMCFPSPRQDRVAITLADYKTRRPRLVIIDINSLEVHTVKEESIPEQGHVFFTRIRWSSDGDKLAFFRWRSEGSYPVLFTLWVYSVAEGKFLAEGEADLDINTLAAWLYDGSHIIMLERTTSTVKVLDLNLNIERTIAVPSALKGPAGLEVVEDKVLIKDYAMSRLWRLDLQTESWKKIY